MILKRNVTYIEVFPVSALHFNAIKKSLAVKTELWVHLILLLKLHPWKWVNDRRDLLSYFLHILKNYQNGIVLQSNEKIYFFLRSRYDAVNTLITILTGKNLSKSIFLFQNCLKAMSKTFHPECFVCAYCGKIFANSPFYLEDGLPYCEEGKTLSTKYNKSVRSIL